MFVTGHEAWMETFNPLAFFPSQLRKGDTERGRERKGGANRDRQARKRKTGGGGSEDLAGVHARGLTLQDYYQF